VASKVAAAVEEVVAGAVAAEAARWQAVVSAEAARAAEAAATAAAAAAAAARAAEDEVARCAAVAFEVPFTVCLEELDVAAFDDAARRAFCAAASAGLGLYGCGGGGEVVVRRARAGSALVEAAVVGLASADAAAALVSRASEAPGTAALREALAARGLGRSRLVGTFGPVAAVSCDALSDDDFFACVAALAARRSKVRGGGASD